MFYDYTQNPPRIFVDEGEGHIVDARVIEAMNQGRPILIDTDENGHAIPIFEKKT
ncbi:MAG: hypothetical protein IKS96_07365 [Fibrobacter sp.]|nr:hypothetical protein [Fibrobacter sp.]MBR6449747.1 hypothetical protein [Fibrobacter sp.]